MTGERAEQESRELIAKTTRRDASEVDVDADLVLDLDLDSLAGLRVLAAFEKHFDLRIPDDELSRMRSIGQLLESVHRWSGETS